MSAFDASAPVDSSSHLPPPSARGRSPIPGSRHTHGEGTTKQRAFQRSEHVEMASEDDDPFGLSEFVQNQETSGPNVEAVEDPDDILGELGKPISETATGSKQIAEEIGSHSASTDPFDHALAELVDMGFSPDKGRNALSQTDNRSDVQAAVGILLNLAHQDSRNKSNSRFANKRTTVSDDRPRRRSSSGPQDGSNPAQTRNKSARSRPDTQSPFSDEKDVSQYAAEIGTSLFKSANTLWKTGQKRVQKVMQDFQQESESNQPRWMREAELQAHQKGHQASRNRRASNPTISTTDEASMLEVEREVPGGSSTRHSRKDSNRQIPHTPRRTGDTGDGQVKYPSKSKPHPPELSAKPRTQESLSRQVVEDQSAHAYVSPARRRKPAPKPQDQEPELDIFSSALDGPQKQTSCSAPTEHCASNGRSESFQSSAPKVRPQRQIPPTSARDLHISAKHRNSGTIAFKRGDYSSAYESYTSALSSIPPHHPITIVILCNRSLTALKTGDTKKAISDAEAALETIGSASGEGETISLGLEEGEKSMREFFGKAIMRKAEALEQTEKWTEAAIAWREAVRAGIGGAVAIQARNRCEKASASPAQTVTAIEVKTPAPVGKTLPKRPKASKVAKLGGSSTGVSAESEAVSRLRAANAAAVAASDEAFALSDAVEARLAGWKAGKADNLRALLASLDTILWEGAGWQKVGMADLVMPNRVKIIYMKAISRVHPDKVSVISAMPKISSNEGRSAQAPSTSL